MKIKTFKELEIWKKGIEIVVLIFKITNSNKFSLDLSFRDQIRKSAISIPSNVAEGFERDNNNEFIRFLRIAKGSCGELITQLEIAKNINYLKEENVSLIINQLEVINAQIGKLIGYLLNRKKNNRLINK